MITFLEPGSIGQFLVISMIPFLILNLFFICREIKRAERNFKFKLFKMIVLKHFKLGIGMYIGFLTVVMVKDVLIGLFLGVSILDILSLVIRFSINSSDFFMVTLFTLCIPITVIEF